MSDLPDELPSDPAELRAFAAALLDPCARLERLLKLAKDAQFGRSSEKLDADQCVVRHMETAATRHANKIDVKRDSKEPQSYAYSRPRRIDGKTGRCVR